VSAGLVAAVCHEIGNLLAGARLLASERAPGDAARIARSLARAGALTALVPALVEARSRNDPSQAADPLEVLEGLWRGIDAEDEARVRVELRSAALLPCARLDAETLHHLLLAQILVALDEGAGAVSVAAGGAPGAVCFRVHGLAPDLAAASVPRAVAEALLGPCGGRAETFPGPGAPGIALWVPEADRPR
jgi:hypothetical protein